MTIVCDLDPATADALTSAVGEATVTSSLEAVRRLLEERGDLRTVVLGPSIDPRSAFDLAGSLRLARPAVGVIMVRRRIDTGLLAEALRAGVREVVDERDLAALNAAVRHNDELGQALAQRTATGDPADLGPPRGRIVTVFSAKGGCGKTTLATNLAAVLADRGRREVCLVDLDLAFGDVAIALQLYPTHTIADAVPIGEAIDFSAIQALLTPHTPGLSTLVAPLEPGSAEAIPADLITRILRVLRHHFDYVIVDTPPAFDDQVLAAFDLTDVVALIATLDIPALKNLKLTVETMDLLNYPRDRWRIVLNRADSKVGLTVSEVEATLKTPIAAQIPSSRDVPAAINRGVPIVQDEPRHAVSSAIRGFAERHVIAPSPAAGGAAADRAVPPELRSDRRGFLRRRSRTT